ncbi:MAG: hypothetical protein KGV51_00175 [Moraxellaceae bacterium]|nr:hypothetical protein [Moraxellaceae bacterium]
MRFIQQLTETINPRLSHIISSVPSENMLEQFYTIYIMRLCDKSLLIRLSGLTDNSSLFTTIWTKKYQQETICHELSISHHLEEELTLQLISEASPLVYQYIAQQATQENQTIFDFLKKNTHDIKSTLPIWVDLVIPKEVLSDDIQENPEPFIKNNNTSQANISNIINNEEIQDKNEKQDPYPNLVQASKKTSLNHKKPSISHQKKTQSDKILKILIVLLIILTLIILGALVWFKKISDAEQTEVILTPEQPINNNVPIGADIPMIPMLVDPRAMQAQANNQNIAVQPAQPHQANNQNIAISSAQPSQANNQNISKSAAQPPQTNNQNIAISSAQPSQANNQNISKSPAQPPQVNNQNVTVPPAQLPPPQAMPRYNEPPIINAPPARQPANEMVFEYNENTDGLLSEAQIVELSSEEIVSEPLENQAQ